MSYNNRFKPNQFYPLPVNQADYHDRPQAFRPNAQKPDESITINVVASDSQGQNNLKLVGLKMINCSLKECDFTAAQLKKSIFTNSILTDITL